LNNLSRRNISPPSSAFYAEQLARPFEKTTARGSLWSTYSRVLRTDIKEKPFEVVCKKGAAAQPQI
jgi:hypothetical protein